MSSQSNDMGWKKYFMPADIDALIPRLEEIFAHIDTCHDRAEALTAKSELTLGANLPSEIAQKEVLRAQVEFLLSAVQDDCNTIAALGGIVKDANLGLVDFLGLINDMEVWLCWKRGETKIEFWHALDAGFGQRQAMPRSHPYNTH